MGGSKKITIGHRYFMGLHMAICHGPVDSINQVYVGKRSLGFSVDVTANSSKNINAAELFGGDEKEGGILGILDFEFGGPTQTVNPYLSTQFGDETPAFRGVTCLVFRENPNASDSVFTSSGGGGYVAAMSPYPKPWAVTVTDIPGGSFNPTKQIVDGVANGGHIIYDCLTNSDWGLGIDAGNIDITSFTEATDLLFNENFGLSIIYAQQSTMEDFINHVLDHINGIVFTDRSTGNFVLKLVRPTCVSTEIPVFNELNVTSLVSFERPAFAEIVNEVTVVYRKRGDFNDTSVTVQDLASIQAQGAVISQTVQYPGIDNKNLAGRVAERDLNQLSTPLARVKLVLNREAWNLNPGDTLVFSWVVYGIELMVLRVLAVNYGTFESGVVTVDAVEDIFNLPLGSYVDPVDSGWDEEVVSAEPSPTQRVFEYPYFTIQTTFEQADIDALLGDTALLQVVAENPPVTTVNFQLHTRIGAAAYENVTNGTFSPTVKLSGPMTEQGTLAIAYNSLSGAVGQIVIGGYAYLDDEVLRIDAIDTVAGTLDLGRGFLDSIPTTHAANALIYFADTNDAVDPTFYTVTDVVNAKVLPQTSIDVLDIDSATELTLTTVGRRVRPYPPAQVKIGGGYFPISLSDDNVDVDWKHQDRTQQLVAVGGSDWFETSLGAAESGVLYDVRYYNHDTSTLLHTDAGVAGLTSSFTPLTDGFNFRVEIDAIRDATETNFVTFSHVFFYTKLTDITGTGTLVAADSAVAGTGAIGITGTGTLVAQDCTVLGADSDIAGTGTLIASDVTVAGAGQRVVTAIVTLVAQDSTVLGSEFDVTGTGSLVSDDSTVSGSGQRVVTGTSTIVAQDSKVAGIGGEDIRTLENGDTRTLENGDNRITE